MKNNRYNFLICYEHISREVENITLLKYELEKRGYSCKIGRFDNPYMYVDKIKADVVVTPWLRDDDNVYHFLRFAKKPYKLVNLQCEQIYTPGGMATGWDATRGEAKKCYHLCWGTNSYNRLIEAGVNKELLSIDGAIQLDYGFPEFEYYYKSRNEIANEFNLDIDKKWILYVSSFSFVNYGAKSVEKLADNWGDYIFSLEKVETASQKKTLEWIEKYLESHDCEFIYRPHPSEKNASTFLKELDSRQRNFHIIEKYTVKQWGKVCDKVNLWTSTSCAELLSLDVDYRFIRPIEVDKECLVESVADQPSISCYEDFEKYNNNEDCHSIDVEDKAKYFDKYYDRTPLIPAYKRIADRLVEIFREKRELTISVPMKRMMKLELFEKKRYFISLLLLIPIKINNLDIIKYYPLRKDIRVSMRHYIDDMQKENELSNYMYRYIEENDSSNAEK